MANWVNLVEKFYTRMPDGYGLYIAPAASRHQRQVLKNLLPRVVPDEIYDLYTTSNGSSLDANASTEAT